ncbi:mechanosensitive ion channel family protein [Salirhabdus sp. Marseille-P4669]|uniref:mechanosensitive ion channel family protein n=1 Tax=Salirhabdus sp. Marseille-P4669 TaxID=2042310 RepID=UPI001F19BCB8|nr:mechanosensitive ion channel family protein [Salirhabdus sp. Marseille-P4669]
MSSMLNEISGFWEIIYQNTFLMLILGAILTFSLAKLVNRLLTIFFKRTNFIDKQIEKTLLSMIRSLIHYAALFGYLIFILISFGVHVGQLLAGAGILSIIVGFGAKSIVSDTLSGLLLLYEKQLMKGDFVTINQAFTGTVEAIGLRSLMLREWNGKLIIINNGQIQTIQNYNKEHMRIVEHVTTSFSEDPSKVQEVLNIACKRLNNEIGCYLKTDDSHSPIEAYQLYGMTSLNNQYRGYTFTIIGVVRDNDYFSAVKEARYIIARTLFEHNIEMAMQQIGMKSTISSP